MHAKFAVRTLFAAALAAAYVSATAAHPAWAGASGLFKRLAGSWHGSGTLTLSDGTRDRISCRGYYVPKSEAGLSIAILCNSPNQKIEIRSRVREAGRGISGDWEERTFNATGQLSGRATDSSMRLAVSGSISGTISVSLKGRSHSVTVSASGTGFKTVAIDLAPG